MNAAEIAVKAMQENRQREQQKAAEITARKQEDERQKAKLEKHLREAFNSFLKLGFKVSTPRHSEKVELWKGTERVAAATVCHESWKDVGHGESLQEFEVCGYVIKYVFGNGTGTFDKGFTHNTAHFDRELGERMSKYL